MSPVTAVANGSEGEIIAPPFSNLTLGDDDIIGIIVRAVSAYVRTNQPGDAD